MEPVDLHAAGAWYAAPGPLYMGGNQVRLLRGGAELFPAMCAAIAGARDHVWLATYIFHDDADSQGVAQALAGAARRGVRVRVVVDGFGSKGTLHRLREWMTVTNLELTVFRPVGNWWSLLQPGSLRRLHQKLCVVDGAVGFVGGINIIGDQRDLNHGVLDAPRLDFAVEVRGPLVRPIEQTARAMWSRAALGTDWRDEVRALARSSEPVARARRMLRRLRISATQRSLMMGDGPDGPMHAAFLVRDNLRQRRGIESAYIEALNAAESSIDLVSPYFYPGGRFRRALRNAARRGVRVRLLLQGKADYKFAALAAQVLYDELLARGVEIHEYTAAFLHAKVCAIDDDWSTVGSSNIDPLSLLLNLEANVIVRDADFTAQLRQEFESALAVSTAVAAPPVGRGVMGVLRRGFVAWVAHWFLRLAGITGRY
ncbi:MAG: cardiolipin synthase ClsB [Aquabacterium sp.]